MTALTSTLTRTKLSAPRTKSELSSDEANNYWAAFSIVTDALTLCLEKLHAREKGVDDPAMQKQYRAARLTVEAQLDSMQGMRGRFNDGHAKVAPPTSELIRTLAIGSAKVTGFAGDPQRLSEVIELTTTIFTDFQKLQEF